MKKKPKCKSHDTYLSELTERLRPKFDSLETKIEYKNHVGDGEIDILALRDGEVYIYEVKCNGRKDHAAEQLDRAEKYLGRKCHKFYYSGKLNILQAL